jgi:DNA-binding response OmpR family regulator
MPFRILLVKDSHGDARLFHLMLQSAGGRPFSIKTTHRLSTGLDSVQRREFEVILLDLGLPESQGIDFLRSIVHQRSNCPTVTLTGRGDGELTAPFLGKGDLDYPAKGRVPP